jgi:hypothetical protein
LMYVQSATVWLLPVLRFLIMSIAIYKEIVIKTTKCPSGYYCLTDTKNQRCFQGMPMCSVNCFSEGLLHVDCPEHLHCPYKAGNGSGNTCSCPIRHEIYNQTEK